jgi:hypothetical protein
MIDGAVPAAMLPYAQRRLSFGVDVVVILQLGAGPLTEYTLS